MSRAHSSKKGSERDLPCDATLKMVFGFIYLFATNRNAMSRAHSSKKGVKETYHVMPPLRWCLVLSTSLLQTGMQCQGLILPKKE